MARAVIEMTTTIKKRREDDPAHALRQALGHMAQVLSPHEAEEPILAPTVRQAMFYWMAEIRAADELKRAGLKPRTTALLYGPPGTGKTTLAHHLAARLGVPMVLVGAESIFKPYLGQSEDAMKKLFDALESAPSPCLLFMDELEAIGGNRNLNTGGGADNARGSTLGVLLRRIETYDGYAIGATNRQQDIDPALWRRFHLQISVDLPGPDERFAILKRYSLPYDIRDDDLDLLTDLTAGASPALLRGLMEGMKRTLIIGPRINRPVSTAVEVFSTIVQSVALPPEMAQPELWKGDKQLRELSAMAWPPAVPGEDAA